MTKRTDIIRQAPGTTFNGLVDPRLMPQPSPSAAEPALFNVLTERPEGTSIVANLLALLRIKAG